MLPSSSRLAVVSVLVALLGAAPSAATTERVEAFTYATAYAVQGICEMAPGHSARSVCLPILPGETAVTIHMDDAVVKHVRSEVFFWYACSDPAAAQSACPGDIHTSAENPFNQAYRFCNSATFDFVGQPIAVQIYISDTRNPIANDVPCGPPLSQDPTGHAFGFGTVGSGSATFVR